MESGLKVWSEQLTTLQHLCYRVHKLAPTHFMINPVFKTAIEGPLEPELLQKSFKIFTDRHEIFRAVFRETGDRVVTYLQSSNSCHLKFLDLSHFGDEKSRQTKVNELIEADKNTETPFDLANGPLMSAILVRLDSSHHVLITRVHHIIWDWASSMVSLKEVFAIYGALSKNEDPPPSNVAMQFNEFALQIRKLHFSEGAHAAVRPLIETLKNQPVLEFKKPHPAKHTWRAGTLESKLPEGMAQKLAERCRELRITPFMFLLSAYYLLLHKITGARDVLIWVPSSSRTRISHQTIIGPMVRGIPFRTGIDPSLSIGEFLTTTAMAATKAFSTEYVLGEPLNEAEDAKAHLASISVGEAAWYTPIPANQFTFDLVSKSQKALKLAGLAVQHELVVNARQIRSDIFLIAHSEPDNMAFTMMYYKEIFDEQEVRGFVQSYLKIVEAALSKPEQSIASALKKD